MAGNPKRPTIDIRGSDFSNNRQHGIAVGKGADVDLSIENTTARDNAGSGFHQEGEEGEEANEEPERRWFERPLGIVALAVAAMGIAYFLGFT